MGRGPFLLPLPWGEVERSEGEGICCCRTSIQWCSPMSATVWYKHYPSDFLHGVGRLTAEERGIYASLLDMMYAQGGSIPYIEKARPDRPGSPARLASACGSNTRRFNIILERLIDDGKVIHKHGRLFNKRVFKELKHDFISTLSLHYLEIIFPELFKFKTLTRPKKPDSRLHKKINKKNDQEGGCPNIEPPDPGSPLRHLYDHVCTAHGEDVWWSWFRPGQSTLFGSTLTPRTKFIHSKSVGNYEDALLAAGFELGEM